MSGATLWDMQVSRQSAVCVLLCACVQCACARIVTDSFFFYSTGNFRVPGEKKTETSRDSRHKLSSCLRITQRMPATQKRKSEEGDVAVKEAKETVKGDVDLSMYNEEQVGGVMNDAE